MSEPTERVRTGDVPMIDLRAWATGTPDQRGAIATAVDDACRSTGFFQVVGHGVPQQLIDDALQVADEFFGLPFSAKQQTAPVADHVNRGFLAVGSEALSYSVGVDAPADVREAFVLGPDGPPPAGHEADPYHVFAPNLWPAQPTGLRPALAAYFAAVAELATTLLDIYAVALQLAPGYFRAFNDHPTQTLRINYYECLVDGAELAPGQQRLGAHTDYGITTVLHADRVPGLERLDDAGRWVPVLPGPGAFVINLGDLLAQWTNDRWRSTIHRVVPSPAAGRRRSLAFFLDGDYDAVVSCLPSCHDTGNPPHYSDVTAGAHLAEKLRGARTHTPAAAVDTVGDRIGALRDTERRADDR